MSLTTGRALVTGGAGFLGSHEIPLAAVPVEVDELADRWSRAHVFQATAGGMVGQGFRYLKRKLQPYLN